jgi:hypothetical protein
MELRPLEAARGWVANRREAADDSGRIRMKKASFLLLAATAALVAVDADLVDADLPGRAKEKTEEPWQPDFGDGEGNDEETPGTDIETGPMDPDRQDGSSTNSEGTEEEDTDLRDAADNNNDD